MNVQGLKSALGAVVVCVIALLVSNFAYSSASNSNLIYNDGWVNTPEKYIPTDEEVSEEVKQEVLEYERMERIRADSNTNRDETTQDEIVVVLMKEYKKDFKEAKWWANEVIKASDKNPNVSTKEILTLIAVESTFNKRPKGNRNVGPMQVNKGVWSGKTKYNIYKPDENIQLGTEVFSKYKRECRGSTECAFKSYNIGPGAYKAKANLKKQREYYQSIVRASKKFRTIA